jgi:pilus assembly protein CpaE
VGATTTAVNLAVSLQQMAGQKSVALMDMNPLLGGVHIFLDVKNSFSWAEGARDIARMDSTYLLNTLYKHRTGIHVLPAPSKPLGLETATPETMEKLVGHMRSAFDIIVMDSCKSFDELSLRMLALSNTILVVSELNILSVVNAKRLLETFDALGLSYGKDIKVVINRYQKKNMVSPGEAEKTIGKKIVSMIPNDYETTMSAINTGKSISDMALKSAVMENFRELAALLLHKEAPRKEKSIFPLNFMGKK